MNQTNTNSVIDTANAYPRQTASDGPPVLKNKIKENYGKLLTIDTMANRILNVSTNCMLDNNSIVYEEEKGIAFLGTVNRIIKINLAEQYKDKAFICHLLYSSRQCERNKNSICTGKGIWESRNDCKT